MILGIQWKDHTVLGNLELDFTNEDGKPFNTIVIAGENGSGKTSVLSTIYSFMTGQPESCYEFIKYNNEGQIFTAKPVLDVAYKNGFYDRFDENNQSVRVLTDSTHRNPALDNDPYEMRHYGCIYPQLCTI